MQGRAAALAVALVAIPTLATPRELLPLQPGEYVRAGVSCNDAPFAGMLTFDGKAFSGPHSNACRSTVISHDGAHYRMRTRCDGDGAEFAKPYTEDDDYTLLSLTRVVIDHTTGAGREDSAAYRLCRATNAPR